MDRRTSAGQRKSGNNDLLTIRGEGPSNSRATEKSETKDTPMPLVKASSKDVRVGRHRKSSTLTFFEVADRKSRRKRGTQSTHSALQKWAVVKENLFIIMTEMLSKEMKKERAIKDANQYAADAVGWDVAIKVESESDYASAKSEITEKSLEYPQKGVKGRCGDGCGLRRRKFTAEETGISRNVPVPNTHISCRLDTFQNLFGILQNDSITYEDCMREYYKPIDIGFFGTRKLHLFLWLAIGTHVFLILAIIVDILAYWVAKEVRYTTQEFTGTILLLHTFCFVFSSLAYIYATQLGSVRGTVTRFSHAAMFAAVLGMIGRAILEIKALDYRREVFLF